MPLSKSFTSSQADAASDDDATVERPTLLLVDDEKEILTSLDFLLQRDYEVLTAENGEKALELLKKHDVSVIVSDQRMPRMSGTELLVHALALSPDTVRILITGYADIESVIQAVNEGKIFFYIEKPWNPQDLKAIIGTAVQHHRLRRERRLLVAELQAANAALYRANAELESRIKQRTQDLHLRNQQLKMQEAEQRHLAHELQEEIGQALVTVKWSLDRVQGRPELKPCMDYLENSLSTVENLLERVRNLSLELRPSLLDQLGLVPTLHWYANRQSQQTGLAVQINAALSKELRLPPLIETTCFRIVQAALANVIRHARAHQVHIELQQRDTDLELIVRDDGIGFVVEAARKRAVNGEGLGLWGIEERVLLVGGQLSIDSAPDRGTEIRARLPLTLPFPESP